MSQWRKMRRADDGTALLERVTWCSSFLCRLRGLMFRAPLAPDEGLLIVYGGESIAGTSIHMFFMRFDIAAIWLDKDFTVVTAKLARRWRPYYAAEQPAQYVLEAPPALLDRVSTGDRMIFE